MSQYKPVNSDVIFIVGPSIDSADGATLETGIAYNAASLSVSMIQETDNGVTVSTITPTTGGSNDWTHLVKSFYQQEVTAAENDLECGAFIAVTVPGVLLMLSEKYIITDPALSDALDDILAGLASIRADAVSINGQPVANPQAGGRLDASIGAMQSGVITADAIANNALSAAKFAADTLTAIAARLMTAAFADLIAVAGQPQRLSLMNAARFLTNRWTEVPPGAIASTLTVLREDEATEAYSIALTRQQAGGVVTTFDPNL